jgi:uncharacterized membrane protein
MTGRLSLPAVREAVRAQLWPVPVSGVLLAVAAGVGLPRLDARTNDDLPVEVTSYLFGGGAGAAREILSVIAGSLITVTALTFSLTVVTLQLASSQFSPRLLRTFSRDRFVHTTLAVFLATFTYTLMVLRTVRSADEDGEGGFVPQASVTLALLLALASVVTLVLFLAHLARQIRVETILQNVHDETSATVRQQLDEYDPKRIREPVSLPKSSVLTLVAGSSGFLLRVDEPALVAAAVEADATVVIDRMPGDWLVAGTPVGHAWPYHPSGAFASDALADAVRRAVVTGHERTSAQDVAYGLRQITDVAVKALSPGINDPTTAVHALGHSAALLCEFTGRDLSPRLLRDEDGHPWAVLAQPDLVQLLDLAVAQPRHYGASDPAVIRRILSLLREVAWMTRTPDQRQAVLDQLAWTRRVMAQQNHDQQEVDDLLDAAASVDQALAGQWPPDPLPS